jgi:hypothetical protein
VKSATEATLSGKPVIEVELNQGSSVPQGFGITLVFDKETLFPLEMRQVMPGQKMTFKYSDVKIDEPMDPASFVWTPPAGVKLVDRPATPDYNAKLLKVGAKAPDFTIANPKGGNITLRQALAKSKKGLLINFWFYG